MVELLRYPTDADWYEVKRRALVTVGETEFAPPTEKWKHDRRATAGRRFGPFDGRKRVRANEKALGGNEP